MGDSVLVDSTVLGQVFGASVTRCRTARGMKQESLAAATRISRPRMSQIENGYVPRFAQAVWIANVLEVSVDAMLAPLLVSAANLPPPDALRQLAARSPQEQGAILHFLQTLLDDMRRIVSQAS